MSALAFGIVGLVPTVSLGASGIGLLRTRSRPTGILLVVASVGLAATLVAYAVDRPTLAWHLGAGALLLPCAFAVLAYPRPSQRHWVEFCLWVTAGAAGIIATVLASSDTANAATLALVVALALIGHGWFVLETDDDADQVAVLWLGLAFLVAAPIGVMLPAQFGVAGAAASIVTAAVVGPAMVIGIRRPGIADVRSLVVAVVVFAVVAVCYISVFLGTTAGLEAVGVEDPTAPFYAVLGLMLAAGYHPLAVVLRGLIDELLFGDRPDPLDAATAVADRIGDEPLDALRAIRQALLLPYAGIWLDGDEVATSGTAVTETRRIPLLLGDDTRGEIVVGLRPGQLTLSSDDEQVLRIVGPLVAQTLRAGSLALDLQQSRTAAIAAIEEERRRLRRDLHDGLGPTLSGIAHTAAAARNELVTDPTSADALLEGLRSDAAAAVAEIRRLVYDMRPPALDELGLVAALRQQVGTTRTPAGAPVHVVVDADELPSLPAAVEVAAYRIATEAVTNSARHSDTDQVWLSVSHECDQLVVTIRDDGTSGAAWVPGVGLTSMRERAAQIGGSIDIDTNGAGSVVVARLPLT